MTVSALETPEGGPIPPFQRHAITIHIRTWGAVLRFVDGDPEILKMIKNMYPRMFLHKDVKALFVAITERFGSEGQFCLLFCAPESAAECIKYATSPKRGDAVLSPEEISSKIIDIQARFYAVFFPAPKTVTLMGFWSHPGVGISSRLAEENLKHIDSAKEVSDQDPSPKQEESPSQGQIRERIAGLLERVPVGPPRKAKVSPDDVYLFQTGMASIYSLHQYLLDSHNSTSVLFGNAFHSTSHVLDDYGPGFKMFGLGTEFDELEAHLKAEAEAGKPVQAVWSEFPANPLLVTPDLGRLRQLAHEYRFVLIIDDTLGSFCNVDVMGVADVVVTSLTKSFSGYADVMAASAVLNPNSPVYSEMKDLFKKNYHNDFFNGDADTLEQNSRNYLARSTVLNRNAAALVEYLETQASNPDSSVKAVFYPSTLPSRPLYEAYMRKPTEEFTPGYGCLFSVEFEKVESTIAFYDNLHVHQGPHLGAHLTLAMPYNRAIYAKELEHAARNNLRETMIRVAVGLEESETLIEVFKHALVEADKVAKTEVSTDTVVGIS